MAHTFISYVKEDADFINNLYKDLRDKGIDVWIDRDKIKPGEYWKKAIKQAITDGAFFIACFSDSYLNKPKSYAHEELNIAIEQIRLMPFYKVWLIPVRLEICSVPNVDIGGGVDLTDIQWIDLFDDWEQGVRRIAEVILNRNVAKGQMRDKTLPNALNDNLWNIAHQTEKEPWGVGIFALPITFERENIKFEGITTVTSAPWKRIMIHGAPASGKTTAIKRVLITAVRQDAPKMVPILLKLNDLNDFKEVENRARTSISDSEYERLKKEGRFLFIYDGLNECPDILLASKNIAKFSQDLLPNKFLVTCRTYEYKTNLLSILGDFRAFQIREYNWQDQKEFIEKSIKSDEERITMQACLLNNPSLQKACSNQFIFLMAVRLIPKAKVPPRLSSDIYEKFLHEYFLGWQHSGKRLNLDDEKKLLEKLAVLISKVPDGIRVMVDERELMSEMQASGIHDAMEVINDLLKIGLLIKVDNFVKFFQETFQEFLVACWLIRKCVYPRSMQRKPNEHLQYDGLEISQLSERFYLEMTGIEVI